MNKYLIAATAVLLSGQAYAADAVVYDPAPEPVASFSWSGFYAGAWPTQSGRSR